MPRSDLTSDLGAEELGSKQRPFPRHSQIDPDALGRAAPSQQGPLTGQSLTQLPVGTHTISIGL